MGYSTSFEMSVYEGDKTIAEILNENEDFGGLDYAVDSDGETSDSVKWYKHEADTLELSVKYPDITFQLNGEGEDQGDVWRKYFRNGKVVSVYAQITFPELDLRSLKEDE